MRNQLKKRIARVVGVSMIPALFSLGCGSAMIASERPDVVAKGETSYGGALAVAHQYSRAENNFPRGSTFRTTLPTPAFVLRHGLNNRMQADFGLGLTGFSASAMSRLRYQWWGAQRDGGPLATLGLAGALEGGGITGVDRYDAESNLRVSKFNFRTGGFRLSQSFGFQIGGLRLFAGPQLTWLSAAVHYTMSDQSARRFTYSGLNPGVFFGFAREAELSWTERPLIVDLTMSISKLPPNLRGAQEEWFPAIALTFDLAPAPVAPKTSSDVFSENDHSKIEDSSDQDANDEEANILPGSEAPERVAPQ